MHSDFSLNTSSVVVDPGTGGVYTLCIRDINNSQEPESDTRVTKGGTEEKYNNKFQKSPVTSEPILETSQNIILSSHKVTDDMS